MKNELLVSGESKPVSISDSSESFDEHAHECWPDVGARQRLLQHGADPKIDVFRGSVQFLQLGHDVFAHDRSKLVPRRRGGKQAVSDGLMDDNG